MVSLSLGCMLACQKSPPQNGAVGQTQTTSAEAPFAPTARDLELTQRIEQEFDSDPALSPSARKVQVSTERGVVTLHGVVPSAEIAATMTFPAYPLVMDVPVMQRVPDAMYEFGLISKPYNITSMIAPDCSALYPDTMLRNCGNRYDTPYRPATPVE